MEVACFLVHAALTCRRKAIDLNRALGATWNVAIVGHAFVQSLDPAAFFTRHPAMPPSFMLAVCNESIFYAVHLVEEIIEKNVVYAAHHAGALATIGVALHSGYYQPMLLVFGIFTVSSPFLYISKWAHHNRMDDFAKLAFALFAAVFFVFRIVAFPMVLKYTWIDSIDLPDLHIGAYITCNTILSALYVLQWHWFQKIATIVRKQLLK